MKLHPYISHKILDTETLRQRLQHWRAVGNKIVFTNGCFDILHLGHVELLAQCRTCGDYVIVGLNSDASVRRLKGDSRPVNDQQARAAVLAALSFVDAVVIFDQDTPLELITAVQPDVLVKGGDYEADKVVGADIVRKGGGEVKIVPLVKGHSTSATISKTSGK